MLFALTGIMQLVHTQVPSRENPVNELTSQQCSRHACVIPTQPGLFVYVPGSQEEIKGALTLDFGFPVTNAVALGHHEYS